MDNIKDFFNLPIFNVLGVISTLIIVFSILYTIYLTVKGVLPVLYRIGMGLSKKEIVVFSKNDTYVSLKELLIGSGLFNGKNIIQVSAENDIGVAENKTIYLINWADWCDNIEIILNITKDKTALIVYASPGAISREDMEKINKKRNAVVTNFRGRLLNDIVTSLITISYKQ